MGIEAYGDWVARRHAEPQSLQIPDLDDPLATTIRTAIDAQKLGLSPERIEELMVQCGHGISVQEHSLPRQGQQTA